MARNRLPVLDTANPAWVTRDRLASMLGYSTRQLDNLRDRFGGAFEARRGSQVYIYGPRWMVLWRDYQVVNGRRTE